MTRVRQGAGSLVRGLLYWAPVWVPLALLWQVATRGLEPALAEQARLEDEEQDVRSRHLRAQSEFEALDREADAWHDPVYRERVRRIIESEER